MAPLMARARPNPVRKTAKSLRAEARLLTTAGLILLGFGFPVTLALVALALAPQASMPALTPLAAGAPPILLGYVACHLASLRMAKAQAIDGALKRGSRKPRWLAKSQY